MNDGRGDVTPVMAIITGALGCVVLTTFVLRVAGTPPDSAPVVHLAPETHIVQPRVIHFAPLPEVPAIEHLVLPRAWAPLTPDERTLVGGG